MVPRTKCKSVPQMAEVVSLYNRVGWLLDVRFRNIIQPDITDIMPDNCFHGANSGWGVLVNATGTSRSIGSSSAMRDRAEHYATVKKPPWRPEVHHMWRGDRPSPAFIERSGN